MLCTRPGLSAPPKRESDELTAAVAALVESKEGHGGEKASSLNVYLQSTCIIYIHTNKDREG